MITNLHVDHHTITTLSPASGGQAGVTYTDQSAVIIPGHCTNIRSHSAVITLCSLQLSHSAAVTHCSYVTQCYNMVIGYAMVTPVSAQVRPKTRR